MNSEKLIQQLMENGLTQGTQLFLNSYGVPEAASGLLIRIILLILLIGIAFIIRFAIRWLTHNVLKKITDKSSATWDDALINSNIFIYVGSIITTLFLYVTIPALFNSYPFLYKLITLLLKMYLVYSLVFLISSFLDILFNTLSQSSLSKQIPVKAIVQVLKISLYFISTLVIFAILLNKDPLVLLSGLGAMTAILFLVFKDAILGFVAGIQLLQNKMVEEGDWIELPKYNANGEVKDITLTTVKVQNWDKTVSNIPAYALISDSFKNWRSMEESGGRRIKRSVSIDVQSIKFCDIEMLQRFQKISYISDYIKEKKQELEEDNKIKKIDLTSLVNGRRMTNIGVFRHYVEFYLKNHPHINLDMTLMIRQLPVGVKGLPVEIYAFTNITEWVKYEEIQADIFDHILSIVQEFDLSIFQNPGGSDLDKLIASR